MRFLFIAHRFHTNLYYQVIALQNANHQVKVLVLYKGSSEYYENIDIQQIKLSLFSRMLGKIFSLLKKTYLKSDIELRLQSPGNELKIQIKRFKPDVIMLKAYQELLALKVLYIAKGLKIKVLMMTQTTFAHIKGSIILFKFNLWIFKKLCLHAFITPMLQNYKVFNDFGIKNVHYIPFVFPAAVSIPKLNMNEGFRILSVGKFVKRKDHLLLIKAVEKLSEKYKIQLQIVGEKADLTYYQQIEDYIKLHALDKLVLLKHNLPYKDISKLYSKFHLFVLPAYDEPAAYSPVEAMSNGLPVICSSQNGTKCYIEESKNGFIFEAKNLSDLFDKIERTISSIKNWEKMANEALKMSQLNHNLKDYNNRILTIVGQ